MWLLVDFYLLNVSSYLIHLKVPLASGKEPACQCKRRMRLGFNPWVEKIPWRKTWQPPPIFLPGESLGQGSLASYSPWGLRVGHDRSDLACTHRLMQQHCPPCPRLYAHCKSQCPAYSWPSVNIGEKSADPLRIKQKQMMALSMEKYF